VKIMDNLMRWFCRRAVEAETDRRVEAIQEHAANLGQHVERRLKEHDARLDLIEARARVKFRDYEPRADLHGDRNAGNGGHAHGGVQ
jgi:hypothetical protein